ncbi:hypothetical protein [Streptomyces smaragdinus]|uniref:hypothetical protein n=1 Tax=Streptomyces smaragdinus TaxID=2585196 RepID=UPI0012972FBA|nr:hypothetical protein [Streptomyces smaragdinus]
MTTGLTLALVPAILLVNAVALLVLYGDVVDMPGDGLTRLLGWAGLTAGCAWTGLLAAGVSRSTTAGTAAALALPVAVPPVSAALARTEAAHRLLGLPVHLGLPPGAVNALTDTVALAAGPYGHAVALTLTALLAPYLLASLRARTRRR